MSRRVQIVGSYLSPYVRKVLAFLDLKGIDYEIDPIVPFMGGDRFTELSPLRRIPLGMKAVELLLEVLLAALPGVDRAAELARGSRAHLLAPCRFTPKKVSPFHRVPVIARATALRLL